MCLCCLLLSSFALYLDNSSSSDVLLHMPTHRRQSLLSLFGRERRPNQPNRASLLSLVKLLAKNNLSSTGGTKEIKLSGRFSFERSDEKWHSRWKECVQSKKLRSPIVVRHLAGSPRQFDSRGDPRRKKGIHSEGNQ